ncbi:response regulator transcription factor [Schleiferilactobacillus shenzhenensis]|uniref:GlnG n=1 Tax=Schleiferilactobacillus shenzhenensis LY-73 TaxID=1231336 RepID=U4TS74_9LACO|nr:response regulator [Schleiferilactobacillus shenzhenensis]ERL64322.1 GlnG [Schleiferilactobacillus shenzhenensis LY-73]
MLKIFIAEDEPLIRDALRELIEKNGPEYDIAYSGEAGDGELALSMIQELKPDLLLADIRMPFMDGLTLSRYAKDLLPWLHVVIISGFSDFNYTQEAIDIGVDGYLTKPVEAAALLAQIRKVQDKIAAETAERRQPSQQEAILNKEYYKEHFFKRLEAGEYTPADLLAHQDRVDFCFTAKAFVPLYLHRQTPLNDETSYRQAINRIWELFGPDTTVLTVVYNSGDLAGIIGGETAAIAKEKADHVANVLSTETALPVSPCHICVGQPTPRLSQIGTSLTLVRHLAYVTPINPAVRVRNVQAAAVTGSLSLTEIDDVVAQLQTSISDAHAPGPSAAKIYDILSYLLQQIGQQSGAVSQKMAQEYDHAKLLVIAQTPSLALATLPMFLKQWQAGGSPAAESKADDQSNPVVEQVVTYLQDHFADPDISLRSIADMVRISPAYLSTLFSQTMNITFIEYLTRLRLAKAQAMLRTSEARITDITFDIGYTDPNYFSFLFKKHFGVSPKEYRKTTVGN